MNNLLPLSSHFKINEPIAIGAVGFSWSSALVSSWMIADHWLLPSCLTFASAVSAFLYYRARQHSEKLLNKALEASAEWADGNVSVRITQIGGKTTKLQHLVWRLNDLMDQVETSQVDMYYSMAYVTYGDFSRHSYPEGLHGNFSHALKRLNALTKVLSATMNSINELMAALSSGNFDQKVNTNGVEGEYAKATENAIIAMQTMRTMIDNIGDVMADVARGDIGQRVTAQGHGDFATLKDNVNLSLDALEGSLNDIARVSIALAEGDLTQSIEKNYPGTFGDVLLGMNRTVDNLRMLVGEIKDSGEIISIAAREIAAGNHDLSYRTEEQAANLEKTATNMNQFTHAVQQNSQNAKNANELAWASSTIAQNGVIAVKQVVTTMEDINQSSSKIVDIISVIDGIAFQTNILALNAAVEAARAGEQGRGFAVVATEVRSLAQRAAAAAGEIKTLIGNSVEKVQDGSRLVTNAGRTMEDILKSIESVTHIISDISNASDDQTAGIEAINRALGQMDDATQQNAALVEEAAAAAKSLEDQTKSLSATIANFKMSD
jgi:methyl-accepting chemotaxis protein